jgi:hypothetical protein
MVSGNLETRNSKLRLYRFLEIPCPDTARADAGLPDASVFPDSDRLKVRQETALGLVVSVADVVTHRGTFATQIACP